MSLLIANPKQALIKFLLLSSPVCLSDSANTGPVIILFFCILISIPLQNNQSDDNKYIRQCTIFQY